MWSPFRLQRWMWAGYLRDPMIPDSPVDAMWWVGPHQSVSYYWGSAFPRCKALAINFRSGINWHPVHGGIWASAALEYHPWGSSQRDPIQSKVKAPTRFLNFLICSSCTENTCLFVNLKVIKVCGLWTSSSEFTWMGELRLYGFWLWIFFLPSFFTRIL